MWYLLLSTSDIHLSTLHILDRNVFIEKHIFLHLYSDLLNKAIFDISDLHYKNFDTKSFFHGPISWTKYNFLN